MTWPDDAFALPARNGIDVGGAQERVMSAMVDGHSGIRTVEEENPDGSITTLRTRFGWPVFETTSKRSDAVAATPLRGFVAKVPGGRTVLFNPYTMAIVQTPYSPASNSYSVQDFGTTWNVAPDDTTHWYDVVLFDGSTIKVNGKAMTELRITANHGFPAIPYVINRVDAGDQYGNAERNTTEKRVFAVGRYSVKSWGGSGFTESLLPTAPRSDNKAMTIGQRTVFDSDTAWLGQLYFTGHYWDSGISDGDWLFSSANLTMLLASTYLVKVSSTSTVSLGVCPLTYGGVATSTSEVSRSMPDAIMQLVGHGILEATSGGFITGGDMFVRFPWDSYTTGPVSANDTVASTTITYSGTIGASSIQAGRPLVYVCDNFAQFIDLTKTLHFDDQITYITPKTGGSYTVYWDGTTSPAIDHSTIQGSYYGVYAHTADPVYSSQSILSVHFEVKIGSIFLINGDLSVLTETGDVLSVSQHNWAQPYLDNPTFGWNVSYGYNLTGQGFLLDSYFGTYPGDPMWSTYAANMLATAQTFIGDEARSTLDVVYDYQTRTIYDYSVNAISTNSKSLTITTKDYVLYDDVNGVYVSVDGAFSGASTAISLSVTISVQTRHHAVETLVYSSAFPVEDILPLREIGSTGKYAIPSPQIRAIFAPLYQEQGSFKGAHYVTLGEENDGASPFHGFNFILLLKPYGDLTSCNDDNETSDYVHFVACNLLEMLYGFVFSSEYGSDIYGARYPVTHSANFTILMSTLFSNPIRVAVKNGIQGAWTDALGSDFASVSTVSLHRA